MNTAPGSIGDNALEVPLGPYENVTLYQDAEAGHKWYYFPNSMRLREYKKDGITYPRLQLTRYNSSGAGKLQFAVSMDFSAQDLERIKTALAAQLKVNKASLQLAGLEVFDAQATLLDTVNNEFYESAKREGTVSSPGVETATTAFVVRISRGGCRVMENDLRGHTGVPVRIAFSYHCRTPRTGFVARVNWSKLHKYVSENAELKAKLSWKLKWGGSAGLGYSKIKNELTVNGCITIEKVEGPGAGADDRVMDLLLDFIAKQILDMEKPEIAPPPDVAAPKYTGVFGGVSISYNVRKLEDVRSLEAVVRFTSSRNIERRTSVEGFMGLSRYDPIVVASCMSSLDDDPGGPADQVGQAGDGVYESGGRGRVTINGGRVTISGRVNSYVGPNDPPGIVPSAPTGSGVIMDIAGLGTIKGNSILIEATLSGRISGGDRSFSVKLKGMRGDDVIKLNCSYDDEPNVPSRVANVLSQTWLYRRQ